MKKAVLISILIISVLLAVSNQVFALDLAPPKVEVLAKSGYSWDGNALPEYQKGRPEITILKITIPPNAQLPLHKHPIINAGVLLKGELTVVTTEKEKLHLKAGNSIIEVVDKWHFGKNEGDTPAEIIVFYAGVEGTQLSIKETEVK